MATDPERNASVTTIEGWISPQLERYLRRAAELADEGGHPALTETHVVLAILEDRFSTVRFGWPADTSLTLDHFTEMLRGQLPPASAPGTATSTNVVTTEWFGPHAAEIREQIARMPAGPPQHGDWEFVEVRTSENDSP